MLTRLFYAGTIASTKASYAERLDFFRTLSVAFGGALAVMLAVFVWSAATLFPLAETHPALATAIVVIKTVAAAVIALTAVALVAAMREHRRLAALLAAAPM